MKTKHEDKIDNERNKIVEPLVLKNYSEDKNKIIGNYQPNTQDK
jgi:hypothetical protein